LYFSNTVCSQTPGGLQEPEAQIHGCMALTHKSFGRDLLLKVLMFNMHEI